MSRSQAASALLGLGFNLLLIGFIADWFGLLPDSNVGSFLRLLIMAVAVSFFVTGMQAARE